MSLIPLSMSFGGQPHARELPAEARVAPALLRIEEEASSPGGTTREEIAREDIRPLSDGKLGAEVNLESPEPEDALGGTDQTTEAETHFWGGAVILPPDVAEEHA